MIDRGALLVSQYRWARRAVGQHAVSHVGNGTFREQCDRFLLTQLPGEWTDQERNLAWNTAAGLVR